MANPILAAKAIALAAKNKDKIGKIILYILLALLIPLFIIASSILGLIELFMPDGVVPSTKEFKAENSAIYKEIKPIDDQFYEFIKQKFEDKKQKIVENVTNENSAINSIKVTTSLNLIGNEYLISYLMYAENIDLKSKTINIDEEKAISFLKKINKVTIKKVSDTEYEIENVLISAEKIAKIYFKDDDIVQQKFIASSKAYADFFAFGEVKVNSETIDINRIALNVNLLEIPLYLQYSGGWESVPFGGGTIASSGCSVTSLAMVMSYLKQQVILPNNIVDFTGNQFYVPPAGQGWGIFPAVAQHWEVKCNNLGKSQEAMIQALSEGKPVISSMAPGTFTRGGHFIVLSGITETGGIKVNDPNDSAAKNFKERAFDVSLIMRESKNFWSFER